MNGRYDLAVAQMKKNHVAVAKHGFTMSFLCECSYGRLGAVAAAATLTIDHCCEQINTGSGRSSGLW